MTPPDSAIDLAPHEAIAARAADFFQHQRFWHWTQADQAKLDAWLAQSILHEAAYLRLKGAVAHAERLAAHRSCRPRQEGRLIGRKFLNWRIVLPLLAAASVAALVDMGLPLLQAMMQPPIRTYSTEVGGRATLKFADGTMIDLNTDTAVRFRMTSRKRMVWLDRGEAWFRVAHNAANPFTVVVGRHRIVDLGTEFLVRRSVNQMEVALLAGRAALSADGTPVTMLSPGNEAVATPVSLSVTKKSPRELSDELGWRRGVLVFRNTPLAEVVREFNRYNATKLVVVDPTIADVKIYAELRTDDYEDLLHLAQSMLKLRVERQGNEILISRENARKAVHARRSSSEAVAPIERRSSSEAVAQQEGAQAAKR